MASAACVPVIAPIDAGRRVLEGREAGAAASAATAAQAPHVVLFAGGASTLEPGAVEEEIVIQGNCVAWTAGGVLRKQFTTDAPVLAAAWCHFQNTGPDPILCLLHSGSLGVYTQDGDCHAVPLPGAFTGLWPLPQGALLTGAAAHGPCILVHPLEAVQEVEMAGGGGAPCGWDAEERVVWSGIEVPYLVTHNTRHCRLAVWSISTQPAQGFVAVTPMRWPGAGGAQAPRTPLGTVAGHTGAGLLPSQGPLLATAATGAAGLSTPTSRLPGGAGPTGTFKKAGLRLPNGSLSPMAFQPVPRSQGATPAAAGSNGTAAGGARLLLPSQELPVSFALLWEQQVDAGVSAEPLEGHLATDTNSDLLLCLLSKAAQRLTALRLPPPVAAAAAPQAAGRRIEVAFTLPALAAAAVHATLHAGNTARQASNAGSGDRQLPPRDLLLLQPDGRLALYAGRHRLCTVRVPCEGIAPAAYAQLLRLGSAGPADAAATHDARFASNHSELSGSKRPPSAAEVRSEDVGAETDEDGDMMLVSPAPRASRLGVPPTGAGAADALPDVQSLADALEAPPAVSGLQNAVGNRVTLQLGDGNSMRVALPCAPTGPLATAAIEALHAVLPPETYWALYARWLTEGGALSADAEAQWQVLARVLLAWAADPGSLAVVEERPPQLHLPRASGTSSGTTATTTTTPQRQLSTANALTPAGQAAWHHLLCSSHHRRHGSRFAWAPAAQPAEEGQAAATVAAGGSGRDEVWRALQALHSVYEDCKMSVLRWQLLPSLGRALLRLAGLLGASGYADHYARDLGLPAEPAAAPAAAGHTSSGPSQAAASAAPPDMFRALQSLLGGQRDGGGATPLLAAQKASCVRRSADLLAAYGLLAEAAASLGASLSLEAAQASDLLQAAAHRIVRLLVRQRWTLADLDCLPWGVALPLRQAIQHCRSSPPTDWPQEAYVLIGRNDIAASMAAAEQEERPAEAAVSSIVSTPLGKMAKTTSPTKKTPGAQAGRGGPALGPGTPTGMTPAVLRRLSALGAAATPPVASATRQPASGQAAAGGSLLTAPECDSSRVLAAPELMPVPYTQRLQLPAVLAGTAGEGEAGSDAAATALTNGSGTVTAGGDDEAGDGMENLTQQAASLRFGRDLRLLEVRRLLRSSAPVTLRMGNVPEPSDAEGTAAQQIKLTVLAIRTCALPLGRGALTLGTLRPLPTEPLHIPPLCLAGRLPEQNNAVVNLDFTGAGPAPGGGAFSEQTAWPEFHNGVAAGLRLAPGAHQLTRTWVVYNKPPEPSYTHAGMLMALGLTGHLSCLAATDLYRYLAQEHDATIIGVLLGMAASKRGSQDSTISKTLFLHLPTRHPSSYPELDISPLVQTAALAGVGLLFQGSSHRVMAEVMLEEIGRRPGAAPKEEEEAASLGGGLGNSSGLHRGVTQDREGYALAAGLALGLITLGKGRAAAGLADLHLEEKLRYFMVGGALSGTVGTQQGLAAAGGATLGAGDSVFGPGVLGMDPTLGEPEVRHGPLPRSSGPNRVVGSVAEELAAAQGTSQTVLEGDLVNLGVTSPAAALALGLMYLQTNDAAVAAAFHLPDTHFALDFVQPEQLTLRMLMRSLVMWDSIQPTDEWLQAQLPPLLHGPLSRLMAGEGGDAPHADYEALAQAHTACVAGACLAVGIRFAGSANARAEALLRRNAQHLLAAKQRAPEPGTGQPSIISKDVIEDALGSVVLALSVVMAGSGHLPTFKLLRGLRKRLAPATLSNASQPSMAAPPTSSLNFGAHCAVSMAMGLLFMGAGTLTFGTSPEAVAALVISLFPRFPASTMDQRCHLQAFRHLYVLAAQPRSVDAIDVDTKQPVYVPLQIELSSQAVSGFGDGSHLGSVLRPVSSVSKGTGDVLAELAAQAAASQQQGFSFDGSHSGSAAGTARHTSISVTFDRIAPCLLPEQKQLAAVRVTGPRYWHQLLERRGAGRGRGPSLAALYATRTLFVQRKAGALPYADDPSGVRSLLSRMVHHAGGGSPRASNNSSGGVDSFDLVNLCSTFGSDPSITSFAQLFCGGGGSEGASLCSRLPVAAEAFRDFCRGALYECVTKEKPTALPAYLLLFCLKQGLAFGGPEAAALSQLWAGLPPSVPLRGLALALAYYDSSLGLAGAAAHAAVLRQGADGEAAAEQWEPVISPLLLQACWQQLEAAWAASGIADGEALRRYTASGALAAVAAEGEAAADQAAATAGVLGAFLQLHGVPPAAVLQHTAERVQDMLQGAGLPDARAAATSAAAMLCATHRGLGLRAAQALAAALLH